MKKIVFSLFSLILFVSAEINFPKLTGRVVDNANILTSQQETTLTNILKQHEETTSNQIVILTIANLSGYEIAEYGYQLGRYWGIGTKEHNNGVLLIVAMKERKIRIEVGYGLEGKLTDKLSHDIITDTITPLFKKQDYYQGIYNGIDTIIKVINDEYSAKDTITLDSKSSPLMFILFTLAFGIIALITKATKNIQMYKIFKAFYYSSIAGLIASSIGLGILVASIIFVVTFFINFFLFLKKLKIEDLPPEEFLATGFRDSYGSSSSSFGRLGGFSGGGGSFGGGGASGGW